MFAMKKTVGPTAAGTAHMGLTIQNNMHNLSCTLLFACSGYGLEEQEVEAEFPLSDRDIKEHLDEESVKQLYQLRESSPSALKG